MENFKIIKPFGPSIVKVRIPEDIVDKLNTFIDNLLENEKKLSKLDHGKNLVGDVTQEFKLEREDKHKIWKSIKKTPIKK